MPPGLSASSASLTDMCGRYASSANPDQLVDEFDIDDILGVLPGPDFNVAPTVEVPAVLERTDRRQR